MLKCIKNFDTWCMNFKWLIIFSFLQGTSYATTLQVSFVSPIKRDDPFWQLVTDVARSAAEDLDIEFSIRVVDIDRFSILSAIQSLSQKANKPDYIIYRPLQGNSVSILKALESSRIPFVTLERGFSNEELIEIGQPQQKFKYWLGEVIYDNKAGGALLASALYKQHIKNYPNKKMTITGISGALEQVSFDREAGLEHVARNSVKVQINQIFPMHWLASNLTDRFPAIYQRYPTTDAYWCAADLYGLNILGQLKKLGLSDPERILIGGFDWLPETIDKIQQGEITASVGGHFLMAANALLKIVEYHNGNNVFLVNKMSEKYELIDKDNAVIYQPFLKKAPWREIDFRQFSPTYNPQQKSLELTVANLLNAYSQLNESMKTP